MACPAPIVAIAINLSCNLVASRISRALVLEFLIVSSRLKKITIILWFFIPGDIPFVKYLFQYSCNASFSSGLVFSSIHSYPVVYRLRAIQSACFRPEFPYVLSSFQMPSCDRSIVFKYGMPFTLRRVADSWLTV